MADTIAGSGGDAALVRVHGTHKALAITTDCTPRYVNNDPFEGGKQAVAEAYRNISATGATPLAVTNNLNFGNPEKPDIMAQIVGSVSGMGKACELLGNLSSLAMSRCITKPTAWLSSPVLLLAWSE